MPPKPGKPFTEGAVLDQAINEFLRSRKPEAPADETVEASSDQSDLPASPLTTMEAILGPETDREIKGRELRNKLRTDMEEKAKGSQNSSRSSSRSLRRKFVAHLSALPVPLFNGAFKTFRGRPFRKHSENNDGKSSRENCIGRSCNSAGEIDHAERPPVRLATTLFAPLDPRGEQHLESCQERKERLKFNRESTVYCPPFSSTRGLSNALNLNGHMSMTSTDTLATSVSQDDAPVPKGIVFGNKSLSPTLTRNHANFRTPMYVERDSIHSIAGTFEGTQLQQLPVLPIPIRSSSLGLPLNVQRPNIALSGPIVKAKYPLNEEAEPPQELEVDEDIMELQGQSDNHGGQLRQAKSAPDFGVEPFLNDNESDDHISVFGVDISKEVSNDLPPTEELVKVEATDDLEVGNLTKEIGGADLDESSESIPDHSCEQVLLPPRDPIEGQQGDTEPFPDLPTFEHERLVPPEVSVLEARTEQVLAEDEMHFQDDADTRSTRVNNENDNLSATAYHQTVSQLRAITRFLSSQTSSQHNSNVHQHQAQAMAGSINGLIQDFLPNVDRESYLICMQALTQNMELLFGMAFETRAQVYNLKQTLREHDRHLASRAAASAVAAIREYDRDNFSLILSTVHTYCISMERKAREQITAAEFKLKQELGAQVFEMEQRHIADFKRLDAKLDTILAATTASNTPSRLPVVQGTLNKMPPHIPWGSQAVGGPTLTEPEEEEPEEETAGGVKVNGRDNKANAPVSTKRNGKPAKK